MSPRISVLMLTFNRELLVGKAIESVLAQTFDDFEYIIVNNGSTDCSGLIAEDYASKDKRIQVIHRERGNIGSGRNAALDAANGEWIAFVDDDDWAEPDFLEFLYSLAVGDDADVSICGATKRVFDEKFVMNPEEALIKLLWRKHYNVQFPTKLIRHKLFGNLRFSEYAKYDDIECMPYLLSKANIIAYHGLPKYTFYRHEGNNSIWTTDHSKLDNQTLYEYLEVYRKRTEWLSNLYPSNTGLWRYFKWSFILSMVEKINRLNIAGCEMLLDGMVKELRQNREEFLACEDIKEFEILWMKQHVIKQEKA